MTTSSPADTEAAPPHPPGPPTTPLRGTPPEPLSPRGRLGRWGEDLAARYLRDLGLEVLERNWRCRHGEVDIVARDGDCLVICEVKTRRSAEFGEPVEAVRWDKALRLRRLAAVYLAEHPVGLPFVRIDVVGVLAAPGRAAEVRHVRGVGS